MTLSFFDHHITALKIIHDLYQKHGHELRFVGGGVRDVLLGLDPHDLDLATTMPAEQGLTLLQDNGITCIPTGLSHGTITVVLNHFPYEVTTLRKDVSTDGRRAKVHYIDDWQEDAARRDFTINAIYVDFQGEIYDYFGGEEDLKRGIIRFIGTPESRILEDYLRILRLFRFYARFGQHPLDEITLGYCRQYAERLRYLSVERITQEIFLLLSAKESLRSLKLMDQWEVLPVIFSSYNLCQYERTLERKKILGLDRTPLRGLYALTQDYHALRLSNKQATYFKTLQNLENHLAEWEEGANLPWITYLKENSRYLCVLFGKYHVLDFILVNTPETDLDLMKFIQDLHIPPFPLKGKELMAAGYSPGPDFQQILSQTTEWWCQNGFTPTKDECLTYVKMNFSRQAIV